MFLRSVFVVFSAAFILASGLTACGLMSRSPVKHSLEVRCECPPAKPGDSPLSARIPEILMAGGGE